MNRRFSGVRRYLSLIVFVTAGMSGLAAVLFAPGNLKLNPPNQLYTTAEALKAGSSLSLDSGSQDDVLGELARFSGLAQTAVFPRARLHENGVERLALVLLDPLQPLKLRRQAAWDLAKLRSAQAFAVLRQGLVGAPANLKATIAEVLGKFDTAESRQLLRGLVGSAEEVVARGAMRGWAALGDAEALDLLSKIFIDGGKNLDLRIEAALSLSKINNAQANRILVESLNKTGDSELAVAVLSGLAEHAFADTEPFFRHYLSRIDVPVRLRVAALEALGEADGNALPILLQHLENPDAEIRAASAWAIARLDHPAHAAPQLLRVLGAEKSAEVRTRIYQALEHQARLDAEALLSSVLNDATASRITGLKLLASQVARSNEASLTARFDLIVVPELENVAMRGRDLQDRFVAIMALKQAKTPTALQALGRVAAESAEPRIVAAARIK